MADAVNLRHRHPRLWRLVHDLRVEAWVAVQVARKCAAAGLTLAQARWVDEVTAGFAETLPTGRFLTLVEAKIIEADPDAAEERRQAEMLARFVRTKQSEHGLKVLIARATAGEVIYLVAVIDRLAEILGLQGDEDTVEVRRSKALGILAIPERVLELFAWADQVKDHPDPARDPAVAPQPSSAPRPPATIYVHVSAEAITAGFGVARIEEVGPVALAAIRELLGHHSVTIKPVVDLTASASVDRYEIPTWMREVVALRSPYEVFPYGTITGRRADKDHSIPYKLKIDGGTSDQTTVDNLAPLGRKAHRVKTHGRGWRHLRVGPRSFLWRTPTGYWYRVGPDGTHPLGRTISEMEEVMRAVLRAA
jgi:hypothetical protein